MTSRFIPHQLDWRDQFDELRRFLAGGEGGVVAIEADEAQASAENFVRILRSKLKSASEFNRNFLSYRIDDQNESTHYSEDILHKLEQLLNIPAASSAIPVQPGAQLASGNRALSVKIDQSFNHADDGSNHRQQTRHRTDAVREGMRAHLETGAGIVLILFNSHRCHKHALSWFWGTLLGDEDDDLYAKGLVVVDVFDPGNGNRHHSAPTPHLSLALPAIFNGRAMEHAIEVLALLYRKENPQVSPDSAEQAARAFLIDRSVAQAYISMGKLMAGKGLSGIGR